MCICVSVAQDHSISEVYTCIRNVLSTIVEIMEFCGIFNASSLNICVTDGNIVASTRYRNSEFENPPSLYIRFGHEIVDGVPGVDDSESSLGGVGGGAESIFNTPNNNSKQNNDGESSNSSNSNNNSSSINSSNNNSSSSSNSSNSSSDCSSSSSSSNSGSSCNYSSGSDKPTMSLIITSSPLNRDIDVISIEGDVLLHSQHNFGYIEGEEERETNHGSR